MQRAPEGFWERLDGLLPKGVRQADLAKRLGVAQPTVGRWKSRDRIPDLVSLATICREFGASADYLLGLPSRATSAAAVDLPIPGDWSAIPRVSEQVAAGESLLDEEALGERDWYVFRNGFLRHLIGKSDPEPGRRLVLVTVARGYKGESMLPTIRPGALVMVDRGPGGRGVVEIDNGKIYLCRPDGAGVTLKRVFRASDRTLMLWSDNPMREPRPVQLESGRRVQDVVLGRVRWVGQEED